MTATTCACCGEPMPPNSGVKVLGRPARFLNDAHRKAYARGARPQSPGRPAEEVIRDASVGEPVRKVAERRSTRVGMLCPADPAHGPVLAWPHHPRWGWYCPHQGHEGNRDQPRTRAFFTTAEAESGVLDPAPRSAPAEPARPEGAHQRQPDQELSEQSASKLAGGSRSDTAVPALAFPGREGAVQLPLPALGAP